MNWLDLCEVICFEVKWNEVSYTEVLGDKSTMHIRVTLYWGYLIVLWLFHLVCILYCGCFILFCNVCVCVCVCVRAWDLQCVGVCMCGFCNVWVFWQLCGSFGNMCTCVNCVLHCLYYVFVLFRLWIFILICFVCTSVTTTATKWKLNCSK